MDTTVLIAGAGPTGLTLAVDLARRGVDFRLVDRADGPSTGSRGKGLQPRSLEVLHDLGVVDEVLASGRFPVRFRGYDGARVLGEWDMNEGRCPTPDAPYPSTVLIPQFRVEEVLRDRLAELGGAVEHGAEVTSFEQDGDGVTAVVGGEPVRAAYLVGCDGGRSTVRKRLGVGFEGETWEDERMVVGDVRLDGLDREHWHAWPKSPAGLIALCPLPGTDLYQLQAPADAEPSLEVLRALVRERTGRDDIVVRDATWMSLYRANVRMVDRYRVGRVFLAGDAAHVHPPAGGQGMNTGIQDAYNLGWKLAAVLTGANAELLDTYQAERLPVAARLLGLTSRLHREAATTEQPGRRDDETLQLTLTYRGGPLAGVGDRAGDRAPDAPCALADGTRTRMFDLFQGPEFTLVGLDADDALAYVQDAHPYVRTHSVVDVDGHVEVAYGAGGGTLLLVRPDGYLGAVTTDPAEAVAYLDQVLG
ncbi:FAD-dependent oxidoreductase [Actinosynnema sp. NPDC050436]|uniref:FAD-dependent oxidoreductase n=1 Tax=Actinosynnema sp. NPDC050436 TaxID=3155659 RepID=UPI0033C9AB0A